MVGIGHEFTQNKISLKPLVIVEYRRDNSMLYCFAWLRGDYLAVTLWSACHCRCRRCVVCCVVDMWLGLMMALRLEDTYSYMLIFPSIENPDN